jgi:hypothetical protein
MLDSVSAKVGERVERSIRASSSGSRERHHIETRPGTGAGGLLDALFSELVQPELRQPTLVVDIRSRRPARAHEPHAPGVVERFELFIAGFELANAFSEQNDPEAQAARSRRRMTRREQGDEEAQVMDADSCARSSTACPPTGGVGIGIDRLVMLVTDSRTIREVILFPALRPEEGRAEIGDEPEAPAAPGARDRGSRPVSVPLWVASRYLRASAEHVRTLLSASRRRRRARRHALVTVLAVMNGSRTRSRRGSPAPTHASSSSAAAAG